jgi:hypothetical protein
MAQLRRS